jgi:hypothetical protein
MTHTPAPWVIRKVNSALTIVDSNGDRIAQASSGKGLPTQAQEYNANLIASAPELLEALEGLCHAIESNLPKIKINLNAPMEKSFAAIKKAKGQ